MANRLGNIEQILMGLEEIDRKYLDGSMDSLKLCAEYIEAINSIRSILGFQILVEREIIDGQ